MSDRSNRGEYHLDVRRTGRGDELTIALRDKRGDVLHHQRLRVEGDEARSLYEGLMTALDIALRYDCEHLSVTFSPAELVDLVRETPREERALSPVQSALRRWTLYQLRSFSSVTFLGTAGAPVRHGPVSAGPPAAAPRILGRA
jgi:hypothetical protein